MASKGDLIRIKRVSSTSIRSDYETKLIKHQIKKAELHEVVASFGANGAIMVSVTYYNRKWDIILTGTEYEVCFQK